MDLVQTLTIGVHLRGRSTVRSINHPTIAFRRWAPSILTNGRLEDEVSDFLSKYPRVLSEKLLLFECTTSYLVYLGTRMASLAASWRNPSRCHSSRWWSSTIKIAIF